jgi:hypothetical protein
VFVKREGAADVFEVSVIASASVAALKRLIAKDLKLDGPLDAVTLTKEGEATPLDSRMTVQKTFGDADSLTVIVKVVDPATARGACGGVRASERAAHARMTGARASAAHVCAPQTHSSVRMCVLSVRSAGGKAWDPFGPGRLSCVGKGGDVLTSLPLVNRFNEAAFVLYFNVLNWTIVGPSQKPMLVVCSQSPGVGKTSLGRRLVPVVTAPAGEIDEAALVKDAERWRSRVPCGLLGRPPDELLATLRSPGSVVGAIEAVDAAAAGDAPTPSSIPTDNLIKRLLLRVATRPRNKTTLALEAGSATKFDSQAPLRAVQNLHLADTIVINLGKLDATKASLREALQSCIARVLVKDDLVPAGTMLPEPGQTDSQEFMTDVMNARRGRPLVLVLDELQSTESLEFAAWRNVSDVGARTKMAMDHIWKVLSELHQVVGLVVYACGISLYAALRASSSVASVYVPAAVLLPPLSEADVAKILTRPDPGAADEVPLAVSLGVAGGDVAEVAKLLVKRTGGHARTLQALLREATPAPAGAMRDVTAIGNLWVASEETLRLRANAV